MNKQQRENIGLSNFILVLMGLGILFGIVIQFVPGNTFYEAPLGRKIVGNILMAAAAYVFFKGSGLNIFVPKEERNWKGGYALWVVIVILLAVGAFWALGWHGDPTGMTTNPVK